MRVSAIFSGVALAAIVCAEAQAATVTTFSFSGSANAGASSTSLTDFPASGVARVSDAPLNYAATVGLGNDDPFIFAVGAAAAGDSDAAASLLVTVEITNDTGVASNATLGALIFAGAVGIANPDFANPLCTQAAIEACGAFLPRSRELNGESASLSFSTLLDGEVLYGGDIAVAGRSRTASFTPGFSLTGFGFDPANSNLFTWSDTLVTGVSLGVFAPGETKILQYAVTATVATVAGFGCRLVSFGCPLALSGFGDPPPGNGGVVIGPRTSASNFLSISFTPVDPDPIPLPPAFLLFGAGIAAIGGRKLFRDKR
ncbi:MAG: hypothetical protein U5J99_11585 [Parvularculaceae bacterium]|nr:hypothetical protein [Parvularculaceae bacterium]